MFGFFIFNSNLLGALLVAAPSEEGGGKPPIAFANGCVVKKVESRELVNEASSVIASRLCLQMATAGVDGKCGRVGLGFTRLWGEKALAHAFVFLEIEHFEIRHLLCHGDELFAVADGVPLQVEHGETLKVFQRGKVFYSVAANAVSRQEKRLEKRALLCRKVRSKAV